MRFKDFLNNLTEMSMKRKFAELEIYHQFNSVFEHLVKVFIGQNLDSAKLNHDWHKQISNFMKIISEIKLKDTNKSPDLKFLRKIFNQVLEDYKETSRFRSTLDEIKHFYKYNNTPLFLPKNEKDFWNLIEKEFQELLIDLSNGKNSFKNKYPEILLKIKSLDKTL